MTKKIVDIHHENKYDLRHNQCDTFLLLTFSGKRDKVGVKINRQGTK